MKNLQISLVIPVKNESDSLAELIKSIERQTFQPAEIILVDGGSTDNTVEIAEQLASKNTRIKIFKTLKASPGKGRNIGVKNAQHPWIAFTDAGIKLDKYWLERLVTVAQANAHTAIIYGNYTPITNSLFEKCAAVAYVPAQPSTGIRGKSIVSYMMKKEVWKKTGGFPDLRAAEDLIFIEKAETLGFDVNYAPGALAHWQLQSNFLSTFRKFVLYSKHNVWAGRQWDWHHGVLKQYLLALPFIILTAAYSWWWFIIVVMWLFARTAKRILLHRFEYGLITLFNPLIFIGVMSLILTIDIATFIGWAQALIQKKD